MTISDSIKALVPEVTEWRRDIHRHPELQYDVHRTAAKVAELLRRFGCDEVVEGVGRTGVVGVIKGRPGSRAIGLRADMDALPIDETTNLAYSSSVPGKMHACGHDGHTAMLLGAAKTLAQRRDFTGNAVVIFQPAEEGGGGGKAMVEDGLMERFAIEEVYGMHNHARPGARAFLHPPGPDHGFERHHRHRRDRQGRPCRQAAREHRSGAGRRPHHHRIADASSRATSIRSRAAWFR